jgi:hypothetical protein
MESAGAVSLGGNSMDKGIMAELVIGCAALTSAFCKCAHFRYLLFYVPLLT